MHKTILCWLFCLSTSNSESFIWGFCGQILGVNYGLFPRDSIPLFSDQISWHWLQGLDLGKGFLSLQPPWFPQECILQRLCPWEKCRRQSVELHRQPNVCGLCPPRGVCLQLPQTNGSELGRVKIVPQMTTEAIVVFLANFYQSLFANLGVPETKPRRLKKCTFKLISNWHLGCLL